MTTAKRTRRAYLVLLRCGLSPREARRLLAAERRRLREMVRS